SRLIIIGTVAKAKNQPKALDALNMVLIDIANRMLRVLKERCVESYFVCATFLISCRLYESYGGFFHMSRLATNFVVTAFDIYFGIVWNRKRINEINIVACESGVYLAIKLIEFIDLYGDSVSMSKFNKIWLGSCPCFYDQQLVAPKGDLEGRRFLVCKTNFVKSTHYAAGVDGAESFEGDELTAVIQDFEKFINS
ncbi:hypothetical protein K443DRAFT_109368, partial [Laccaria amethystina LaAM-08-1]